MNEFGCVPIIGTSECYQRSKLGEQKLSRISRLEMMFESGRNFATATEVLIVRATKLVAFATVFVAVSNPGSRAIHFGLPLLTYIII